MSKRIHSVHMQGVVAGWLRPATLDREVSGAGLVAAVRRCVLGQGTSRVYMHSLHPGVTGYLVGQRLLVCSSAVTAAGPVWSP